MYVDANGPAKLVLFWLVNFHTRTSRIQRSRYNNQARWEEKSERTERIRVSLMKRNLIKMDVDASGIDFHVPRLHLLQPRLASSLLPGLFQDRRVSRSHTCIINETCHAARTNFDVQIRSDTDQANDDTRVPSQPCNFSKRYRNMNCLTRALRPTALPSVFDGSLFNGNPRWPAPGPSFCVYTRCFHSITSPSDAYLPAESTYSRGLISTQTAYAAIIQLSWMNVALNTGWIDVG